MLTVSNTGALTRRSIAAGLLAAIVALAACGWGAKKGEGEKLKNAPHPTGPLRPDPTGPPPEGMVLVKGGDYAIGSESGDEDERPAHKVTLDPYYIDVREVTNADFAQFVSATGYKTEGFWTRYSSGRDTHPVVAVTWNDAAAYAQWAGKRLPTEAEWEVAARGGVEAMRFPRGDEISPDEATFGALYEDSPKTTPVGSHAPNGYGLYDVAGNAWEWCADYYAPDAYARSDERDPAGPERGATRVVRGGSWNDRPEALRVSNRLEMTPTIIGQVFGFRCAKTPEE